MFENSIRCKVRLFFFFSWSKVPVVAPHASVIFESLILEHVYVYFRSLRKQKIRLSALHISVPRSPSLHSATLISANKTFRPRYFPLAPLAGAREPRKEIKQRGRGERKKVQLLYRINYTIQAHNIGGYAAVVNHARENEIAPLPSPAPRLIE